jgi:hypothetical protein
MRTTLSFAGVMGVLLFVCGAAAAQGQEPRVMRLTLPPPGPAPKEGIHFLPAKTDPNADAARLYTQATDALPKEIDPRVYAWLGMPLEKLPVQELETVLAKYASALKLLEESAHCGKCDLTQLDSNFIDAGRTLARLEVLRARLQIARGQFGPAATSIGAVMAMGCNVARSDRLIEAVVGVRLLLLALETVEPMMQTPGCPSLGAALEELPAPLADISAGIKAEPAAPKATLESPLRFSIGASQLARLLAVAEALHSRVAATGQLPESLEGAKLSPLDVDPATHKAFLYQRTTPICATLQTPPSPPGAFPADTLRLELTFLPAAAASAPARHITSQPASNPAFSSPSLQSRVTAIVSMLDSHSALVIDQAYDAVWKGDVSLLIEALESSSVAIGGLGKPFPGLAPHVLRIEMPNPTGQEKKYRFCSCD